jgi:ubiquitin C-terminal hydrolase
MGGLQARAEAASRQAKKEQQQSSSKRLPIFADILHEDSNDNASSAQWAPNMM